MHSWNISRDLEQASLAAAEFLVVKIMACIDEKNICHVALPGGNTPAISLSALAQKDLDWKRIHWYLGDERCHPIGHEDRNDVMLYKNLWSLIDDELSENIHCIPAELGAERGAEEYQQLIDSIECIDIAFLGMGEDGHTASLFPGNAALDDQRSVVPVHDSPKAPDDRVSLGINTLKDASERFVLTAGPAKAAVISRIQNDEDLPINLVGDIVWFVDEAAMPS